MQDIHRELMERCIKDTVEVVDNVEATTGKEVPEHLVAPMCTLLFKARIAEWKSDQGTAYPEPTDKGKH